MDLVKQARILGLTNIRTFGPNISLIRQFSLILNYAKPRLSSDRLLTDEFKCCTIWVNTDPKTKDTRDMKSDCNVATIKL